MYDKVSVHACVQEYVHECVCMCIEGLYMHECICICVRVCACMCICACIRVYE